MSRPQPTHHVLTSIVEARNSRGASDLGPRAFTSPSSLYAFMAYKALGHGTKSPAMSSEVA
jgi:hypothetical protein